MNPTQDKKNIDAFNQVQQSLGTAKQYVAGQGVVPVIPINSTITSGDLTNSNPRSIPQPTASTTNMAGSAISGLSEGVNSGIQDLIKTEQTKATNAQTAVNTNKSTIDSLLEKLSGKANAQATAEGVAGIPDKAKALTEITNEYNSKQLAFRRQEEAILNQPNISREQANAQLAEVSRKNNQEKADIAIRQSVAMNDLNTAQSLVNHKIDLEYGDLKDIIAYQKDYLSQNQADLSKAQQNQLQLSIQDNTRKYEEGVTASKNLETTRLEILKNMQENNAPQSAMAEVQRAKTPADVIAVAGKYGIDATRALQRENLRADIAKSNNEAKLALTALPAGVQTKVQSIAGQFDNEQAVKNYQAIAESVDAVRNAGVSPTDDIQRIYAVAKVLDPSSAVKEGEYKTVEDYAQSLFQRTGKKIQRVFDNAGFLTPEARTFISSTLNNRLASSEKAYNNIASEYSRRIDKVTGKTDGKDYITDYSKAFTGTQASSQTVKVGNKEFNVGQVYNDGTANWTVDSKGKWTKQ